MAVREIGRLVAVLMISVMATADDATSLDGIRAFAAQRGLTERIEGDGTLRILWFGVKPTPTGAIMLKNGLGALALADTWTGGRNVLGPRVGCLWLVLLPEDKNVFDLVDQLRAKGLMPENAGGQDIYKLSPGWPLGSAFVYSMAALTKDNLHAHFAAYAAACLAVDAYYDRAKQAPSWIREGFATEVQRMQFQTVSFTTVSYEVTERAMGSNWMQDTAQVLKGKVKGVKPLSAVDVLRGGLEAIPFTTYRQYCNLFAFLRDSSQARKGAKNVENSLAQILVSTRDGVSSEDAVAKVFSISDPQLTAAWYAWAAKQH